MPSPNRLHRLIDIADTLLCRSRLTRPAGWDDLMAEPVRRLYAGRLYRGLPQFRTHYGLTPHFPASRNIVHDVTQPYPIPDNSVEVYQSEDVFEHVPIQSVSAMLTEIHRILRPGGLLRLSLPDYNFDVYRDRSIRREDGTLVFDPDGGGHLGPGERVLDGGHLWFPTIDTVMGIVESSAFAGVANYLQYNESDGSAVIDPVDYSKGYIARSAEHDARVADRPRAVSIIVDMTKH